MADNRIPTNSHSIPLDQAIAMTRRYRENRDQILQEQFSGNDILPLNETFNKDSFNALFNNPLVKALRIYYGMTEDLQIHSIIVGVNENNEDMLPQGSTAGILNIVASDVTDPTDDDPNDILEDAVRCPPYCPPPSPINTP